MQWPSLSTFSLADFGEPHSGAELTHLESGLPIRDTHGDAPTSAFQH
jgi:hypothetical protein